MKMLLATNHLGLGGSESYLITVAEQLDRLGHEPLIHVAERGAGVAVAEERGLTVLREDELPEDADAAIVQDASVSLRLASRLPSLAQLFVAHSESIDLQTPPQLGGVVSAAVALNERVADRLRSFAVPVEVVRLRQPIDTERFVPPGPLPPEPRRVLLLSNTSNADRVAMLEQTCGRVGLELLRVGGTAGQTTDPRAALAAAEIVVGYGRSILEAMACGRAAYVYDAHGGEGWITADTYPAIEADGIAGRSGRRTIDVAALAADLAAYDPSMGPVNHDLVIGHHRANVHAQELVGLLESLAPPSPSPRPQLEEMARLVRLEWRARQEVASLRNEATDLRRMLVSAQREDHELRVALGDAEQRLPLAEERVRRSYEETLSWRLSKPLRALTRIRRRFGR